MEIFYGGACAVIIGFVTATATVVRKDRRRNAVWGAAWAARVQHDRAAEASKALIELVESQRGKQDQGDRREIVSEVSTASGGAQ
jgi:hypothetical protein